MTDWKEILGDWERILKDIIYDPKVVESLNAINKMYLEGRLIYPEQKDVFRAFRECPYSKLSVIIILQDPYHDGSATGLAMANEVGRRMSPSLRIVRDTISRNIYNREEFDFDSTLISWAKQGILMLNAALTVEENKPLSHQSLWSYFTQRLLTRLSEINSGIIYCLWGKQAEAFSFYINHNSNTVLSCNHPVSSAYSGTLWDCNHFEIINKILKDNNNITIKW